MKLVIKRTKKSGITGKSKYELYVRADVTDEEATLIKENSLNKESVAYHDKTGEVEGVFALLIKMFCDTNITVDTFVRGTTFSCKNVLRLMEIEDNIRDSALSLRGILEVAKKFGGEEVIDVNADFLSSTKDVKADKTITKYLQ